MSDVVEKCPIPKEGRLALGQRVKVRMHMRRNKNGRVGLEWNRVPYMNSWHRQTEPEGIVIGVRTVYEGETRWTESYGTEFRPSKVIGVYLVAINMAQILRVLPGDLSSCQPGGDTVA